MGIKIDVWENPVVYASTRDSSGLCVRQIENEQQSTVGEVSQRLKVMALARRPAGPDNASAVPSFPGSDSWLSEKKKTKKKNPKLVPARLGAVKLHLRCYVVGTFWMLGSSRAFDFV